MPSVVLLVDDDADIREALGECLRDSGYEVHAAENGRVAVEILQAGLRPEVILLDLMMPVMNGFDFLEARRRQPDWQQMRVIIVSANQGYEASDFNGVFQVFRKPLDVAPLCRAIDCAAAA
jgi:CheY-like chemotaxis protein